MSNNAGSKPAVKPTGRARGRPIEPALRERILDIAGREFLKLGFGGTSVDHLAETTGVSKATIYRIYGNKEGLFSAIEAHMLLWLDSRIQLLVTSENREPEEVLFEVALEIFRMTMAPGSIAMSRLAIAEQERFPSLGIAMHKRMHEALVPLAKYLRLLDEQGILDVEDAAVAAYQFAVLAADGTRWVMLPPLVDPEARVMLARATVKLFLNGYRKHSGPTARQPKKAKSALKGG